MSHPFRRIGVFARLRRFVRKLFSELAALIGETLVIAMIGATLGGFLGAVASPFLTVPVIPALLIGALAGAVIAVALAHGSLEIF